MLSPTGATAAFTAKVTMNLAATCSYTSIASAAMRRLAIAASIVQIAWFHWRGSVSSVHWLSLAIIVVFGGATLVLRDETFIKWKPTVLYLAFAVILVTNALLILASFRVQRSAGRRSSGATARGLCSEARRIACAPTPTARWST